MLKETVPPSQPFDDSIRLHGPAETSRPPAIEEPANQGRFSFMLNALTQNWRPHRSEGVFVQKLELGEHYAVILVRLSAGARLPAHRHGAAEDTYVLSGQLQIAGQRVRAGDFHHADAGSTHGEALSAEGCIVLMIVSVADYQNTFGSKGDS